ncbi:MAG TPA: S-layer homology domain-containing protein [Firmicutes bacterium]|nr:S-layer homology domain-containing protein [Bacillota bacterium]
MKQNFWGSIGKKTACLFLTFGMVLQSIPAFASAPTIQTQTVQRLDFVSRPELGYDFALGRDDPQQVFPHYGSDGTTDILLDQRDNGNVVTMLHLDLSGKIVSQITIQKPLPLVGAFTRDEAGDIYLLCGQGTSLPTEESVRLVRYSANGEVKDSISWTQRDVDTVRPFDTGASLTVRDGRAIILFGRLIDSMPVGNSTYGVTSSLRHQGSCLLFVDTDQMKTLAKDTLSASHSLSQTTGYLDGMYYALERGDGNPRAFQVRRYQKNGNGGTAYRSFRFKSDIGNAKRVEELEPEEINGHTYVPIATYADMNNNTFSIAGDMISLGGQWYFTGTYENTSEDRYMSPRNLFIQKIDGSAPVYLTNYTDESVAEAGAVRAVTLPDGGAAILYEETKYTSPARQANIISGDGFDLGFERMAIHLLRLDETGKVLSDDRMTINEGVSLSCFDPVAYDSTENRFRWVCYSGRNLYFNTISFGAQIETGLLPQPAVSTKTSADFPDTAQMSQSDRMIVDWGLTNGVVSGGTDGLFHPWALVTRAEFAVMLVRAYHLPLQTPTGMFTDVPAGHWAASYIEAMAREANMTGGVSFHPDGTITREEADRILVDVAHLADNIDLTKTDRNKVYDTLPKLCHINAYYLGNNRELKRISAIQMMQSSTEIVEVYYDRLARDDQWRARLKNGSARVLGDNLFVPKNP